MVDKVVEVTETRHTASKLFSPFLPFLTMNPFPVDPTVATVMEWFTAEVAAIRDTLWSDSIDCDGAAATAETEDRYTQAFSRVQSWLDSQLWNHAREQLAEQTGDLSEDVRTFWDNYVTTYRSFAGQIVVGSIASTHDNLVRSRARIADRASRSTGEPVVESSVDPDETVHVLVAASASAYDDRREYICSYTPGCAEAYTQIAIIVDEIRRQNEFLAERYYDRMYWATATPHHQVSLVTSSASPFMVEGMIGQNCRVADFRRLIPSPVANEFNLGLISRDNVTAWSFRIVEAPVGSIALARLQALPNVWSELFRHDEHLEVRLPEYTPYMREPEYEAYVDRCEEAIEACISSMPPLPSA